MSARKVSLTVASVVLAGLAIGSAASTAKAQCYGYGYGYCPPPVYVAPAPVYYPPPVYVAPAPVVVPYYRPYYGGYYPRPHYARRSYSFGFGYSH